VATKAKASLEFEPVVLGHSEVDSVAKRWSPKIADRSKNKQNPFPGEPFFIVPLALYDNGLAYVMRPSEIIRYITLLRVANYRSSVEIPLSLERLAEMDGIAPRTAWLAHRKLQERGLISITKTKPHIYRVFPASQWPDDLRMKPRFKNTGLIKITREFS
jgi:hypothetical protein